MRKNVSRGVIIPVDVTQLGSLVYRVFAQRRVERTLVIHAETRGKQLITYANAFLIWTHFPLLDSAGLFTFCVERFRERENVGKRRITRKSFSPASNIEQLLTGWLRACRGFNRRKKNKKQKRKSKKHIGEKTWRKKPILPRSRKIYALLRNA